MQAVPVAGGLAGPGRISVLDHDVGSTPPCAALTVTQAAEEKALSGLALSTARLGYADTRVIKADIGKNQLRPRGQEFPIAFSSLRSDKPDWDCLILIV